MTTFNNNVVMKRMLVASAIEHRKNDEYVRRENYSATRQDETFRGDFIRCSIYDIARAGSGLLPAELAHMFGTPEDEWLFHYLDYMFERLPIEESAHLAEQFYGAMPVGVDVEPLKHMLAIRRMRRLLKIDHGKMVNGVITGVLACHEQALAGKEPDWEMVISPFLFPPCMRIDYTDYFISESAPASAAEWAIRSVEWAVLMEEWAASAESAAASAEWATGVQRSTAWRRERDDLLELLPGLEGSQ